MPAPEIGNSTLIEVQLGFVVTPVGVVERSREAGRGAVEIIADKAYTSRNIPPLFQKSGTL